MIDTVLFDLDGTLLGMDYNDFEDKYFNLLANKFTKYGEPEKLIQTIWDATIYMVKKADGKSFNNERFFKRFNTLIEPIKHDIYLNGFLDFYDNEYDMIKDATFKMEYMIEAVRILKDKGYNVIIATNPLFPEVAILKRIDWAGFSHKDFSFITNFEICRYCKPNIKFYYEISEKINKKPEQCLMVGNDMLEDMIAKETGMKTYLINDCIIKREKFYEPDYKSESEGFLRFVENLPIV